MKTKQGRGSIENGSGVGAFQRKLVVVGDGECGKTSLLITYCRDEFPEVYTPTIFEMSSAKILIDDYKVDLSLWDTAGQEDYKTLRSLSYPDADVIIICYAVDNPECLVNVEDKWYPEIHHFCPCVPIILVATKSDLREDESTCQRLAKNEQSPVTTEQGVILSDTIHAHVFLECSAKTQEGVTEVFEQAARAALLPKKKPHDAKKKCVIL